LLSSSYSLSLIEPKSRAIDQAVSCWLPTTSARVCARSGNVGFVVDKVALGQVFFPSTSVSPANHHYTTFFIILITRGRHNRPIGSRSAKWTQLDYNSNKKIIALGSTWGEFFYYLRNNGETYSQDTTIHVITDIINSWNIALF
jgi:hypothetical protein